MQLNKPSRRKVRPEAFIAGEYPHHLQMYSLPPTANISLQEFEEYALDRLKALRNVETIGIRHVRGTAEYKKALDTELRKGSMKGLMKQKSTLEERRRDHFSHFILRLAFCRSEELKRWFIAQEVDLFRHRFSEESADIMKDFLEHNNLKYEPIPLEEKNQIINELTSCTRGESGHAVESSDYYKVPFIEVIDLVKNRKVYLHKGWAYVPHSELVVIVLTKFRENLSKGLAMTARIVPSLEEDDRLVPVLKYLSNAYIGKDYSSKTATEAITAEMVDGLSKKSFPLCMQQLHSSLRQYHHLRHWGRQQYGLFLKGIGLSLEEAMRFWRTGFAQVVDADKFDKQHAYNIRFNYGKEGKRTDYTPYSCVKIITSNAPGVGDYHGCPFKHTDADLLAQRLSSMSLTKPQVDEVIKTVKDGHYQVACGKVFACTHFDPNAITPTFNHPNQYFEESQSIIKGANTEAGTSKNSQSRGTPVIVRSQTIAKSGGSKELDFDDEYLSQEDIEKAMEGITPETAS